MRSKSELNDAADDEVSELNFGKTNSMATKPEVTKKPEEKVDFGLPDHGAFSDAHDGQKNEPYTDRRASISTQKDFSVPDVLQEKLIAGNTSSFEPTSGKSNDA